MFDKNNPISQKLYNHEISFYTENNNKNPFICRFYGSYETSSQNVIIIEYIVGYTLREYIEKKGDILKSSEKIKIILEIMSAIEYMHFNNYIYRDLKYDNIMIDSFGNAILIDFDQAKIDDGNEMTGDIGGSYFMSPEQFQTNIYSFETDIYSLGIIIHFILTKKIIPRYINDENNLLIDAEYSFEYDDYYDIYKHCLENQPKLRPNIYHIFNMFLNIELENKNNFQNKPLLLDLFQLRENLYLSNSKCQNKKEITPLRNFLGYFICFYYNNDYFYNKKITQDNSNAQYMLGLIYYENEYVSQDISKAFNYFTLAANQNNSDAQYMLGFIYYENKYVSQDIYKAIQYFILAANQNNSDAQCMLGLIYYENKYISQDINKSIHFFTLSANQNNIKAQIYLGKIYFENKYVPRNIKKAIHYLTLSVNQYNSDLLQYYLGFLYLIDSPTTHDLRKAIYYFTLSADQNNYLAQYSLGIIYYFNYIDSKNPKSEFKSYFYTSNNQPQYWSDLTLNINNYAFHDTDKAIHYFTLSANQNYSYAQLMLGEIYYRSPYVPSDINKSLYYLYLSSKQNNSYADFRLGEIFYLGELVQRDINKAFHYLTLSANQQNSFAQCFLGEIYYIGKYVPKDINKAIYYLTLAANQSNSDAQYMLGIIYYENKYASRNIKKAIYFFELSAKQNDPDAQYKLGRIYYFGKYVPQDIQRAIHYLTLSSKNNNSDAQFLLGNIYNYNKNISRDINKAIYYYKESSCFRNNRAKNNLAILYKNGIGVQKNIFNAIEYFEEAIKQKNDSFSLLNLARIFYFGIDVECDIPKSIQLLEKITNNFSFLSSCFLFYIYTFGNKEFLNKEKSLYYQNKIQGLVIRAKYIISLEFHESDHETILKQRFECFFKEYDFEYSDLKKPFNDIIFFICTGSYHIQTKNDDDLHELKDINNGFYAGFYDN